MELEDWGDDETGVAHMIPAVYRNPACLADHAGNNWDQAP
ncbi:hypothetical protein K788_0004104 [Paraburkholderia caribensis MBA4]|uniref:Uncharacterized protein n=1 Tax=Paraburkholderia caribensis MBA4 TaxID=1323664 RepID=A0A0N7JTC6_9BURK|nr:hypothetical protein K788_0004104 [Paraburkholderia caribensis MBA4]